MFTVNINGEKRVEVKEGQSLYEGLAAGGVLVPSACGGRAICGYCKVKVSEGGGEVLPSELPFLSKDEQADNIRLACQVKVNGDISIEMPLGLLKGRRYKSVCSDIEELTHNIRRFRFELFRPKTMDYIPGQFVQFRCPVYLNGGEEVYRSYSIAGDPSDKGSIELIIQRAPKGICTTYCFEHLKVGDEAIFNGPCGDFHLSDTDSPIVFIAGGSGMAPIRCMLNHLRNIKSKRKIVYYFGANKVNELFMIDEMKRFEEAIDDFRFLPIAASVDAGQSWDGFTGLVTEYVENHLENAAEYEAYLCGSPGLIEASGKVLAKLGMRSDNIFYDSFG